MLDIFKTKPAPKPEAVEADDRPRKVLEKLLKARGERGLRVQALARDLAVEFNELLKAGEQARNLIGIDATDDLNAQSMAPNRLAGLLLDFMAKVGAHSVLARRPISPAHEVVDFGALVADQNVGLLARFKG